jgi:hypothetical protein
MRERTFASKHLTEQTLVRKRQWWNWNQCKVALGSFHKSRDAYDRVWGGKGMGCGGGLAERHGFWKVCRRRTVFTVDWLLSVRTFLADSMNFMFYCSDFICSFLLYGRQVGGLPLTLELNAHCNGDIQSISQYTFTYQTNNTAFQLFIS